MIWIYQEYFIFHFFCRKLSKIYVIYYLISEGQETNYFIKICFVQTVTLIAIVIVHYLMKINS